ncbi:hypothetical protein DSO57_1001968 [Entomophthora muscae]|uniref:Uncharacterized protein n=1 Tax=Entomophthora muscae TaxID=34485 RepID=A0ACC2RNT3_9FUNG|nr:hypothetical protein DSO57_1001968 [Entomophthora muscae]
MKRVVKIIDIQAEYFKKKKASMEMRQDLDYLLENKDCATTQIIRASDGPASDDYNHFEKSARKYMEAVRKNGKVPTWQSIRDYLLDTILLLDNSNQEYLSVGLSAILREPGSSGHELGLKRNVTCGLIIHPLHRF